MTLPPVWLLGYIIRVSAKHLYIYTFGRCIHILYIAVMKKLEKLEKGTKVYLDEAETKESVINGYLKARDGYVEAVEFRDMSGYGNLCKVFLCGDTKHECVSLVHWYLIDDEWREESWCFDTDSWEYVEQLINGKGFVVRDYMEEMKRV